MKPETILHADLLDIVFENRNKDYGAYVLRKQYPEALHTALTFVIATVILMSIMFLSSGKPDHLAGPLLPPDRIIDSVVISPPPPAPDLPPPPPRPIASIEHVSTVIANDGTDTIPTIDA